MSQGQWAWWLNDVGNASDLTQLWCKTHELVKETVIPKEYEIHGKQVKC